MDYINDNYVLNKLKKRDRDAHKGDFGKVLIFAGSVGMAGAAILCGRAALRTGSGLVRFLLPSFDSAIYPVLQEAVPEATCISFEDGLNLSEYDAIAAGCGIGRTDIAKEILAYILKEYRNPLLLDADALNIISEEPKLFALAKDYAAPLIITPHVGEAKRLSDSCAGISSLADRKNAAYDLSDKFDCIAILKGAGTLICFRASDDAGKSKASLAEEEERIVSTPSHIIYENTTGNPGMATGGSGDVLSGIITSLLGQGYASGDAACLGVFIHGKAGDLAAESLGEMSVTAGDIVDFLPDAFKLYY